MSQCSPHLISSKILLHHHGLTGEEIRPYQLSQFEMNSTFGNTTGEQNIPRFTPFCRFILFYSPPRLDPPQVGRLLERFVFENESPSKPSSYHLYVMVIVKTSKYKELERVYCDTTTVNLPNFAFLNLDVPELFVQPPKGVGGPGKNFVRHKLHAFMDIAPVWASTQETQTFQIGGDRDEVTHVKLSLRLSSSTSDQARLQNLSSAEAHVVTDFLANRSIKIEFRRGDKQLPIIRLGVNSMMWLNEIKPHPTIVFVGVESLSFLSCYAEYPLTFDMYSSPFAGEVWLFLGLAVVGVSLVLVGYGVTSTHGMDMEPINVLCYVWGTLLQQITPPRTNSVGIRTLLSVWMLVVCILTNAYVGVVIMYLNATFPPKYPTEWKVILNRIITKVQ